VVARQSRETVTDVDAMCDAIRAELEPVEDQWGVRILKFGFSNISPSPTTLEITQLELLTREKRRLYGDLRERGLTEEAAVALVSGAVVSVHPEDPGPLRRPSRAARDESVAAVEEQLADTEAEKLRREVRRKQNEMGNSEGSIEDDEGEELTGEGDQPS